MLVNISLGRNTIADRVCEMSTNLRTHLSERSRDFIAYSLAVDESTNMTDTAQLAIFIRRMYPICLLQRKCWTLNRRSG